MCNFETLFSSSFGFVIRCQHCHHIQVAFGNVSITFRDSDFKPFTQWVGEMLGTTPVPAIPYIKNIKLPTPCEGFQLLLCYEELQELFTMLDTADTELQVQFLLHVR